MSESPPGGRRSESRRGSGGGEPPAEDYGGGGWVGWRRGSCRQGRPMGSSAPRRRALHEAHAFAKRRAPSRTRRGAGKRGSDAGTVAVAATMVAVRTKERCCPGHASGITASARARSGEGAGLPTGTGLREDVTGLLALRIVIPLLYLAELHALSHMAGFEPAAGRHPAERTGPIPKARTHCAQPRAGWCAVCRDAGATSGNCTRIPGVALQDPSGWTIVAAAVETRTRSGARAHGGGGSRRSRTPHLAVRTR